LLRNSLIPSTWRIASTTPLVPTARVGAVVPTLPQHERSRAGPWAGGIPTAVGLGLEHGVE